MVFYSVPIPIVTVFLFFKHSSIVNFEMTNYLVNWLLVFFD